MSFVFIMHNMHIAAPLTKGITSKALKLQIMGLRIIIKEIQWIIEPASACIDDTCV